MDERFGELAHALQYGTAEEAGDALRELISMKEEGKIPTSSPIEKLVDNMAMRQKIEEQREDAVAREISGEDPVFLNIHHILCLTKSRKNVN